ncbi:YgfZ/GcvT domain-containing protein [Cognatilysobacter bugurensis]|uniref:Folate-binding protein YgfZ n=1 Tax=Cognatilysobacter bugurensis TaxID=543356 RepID=A0A918SVD4_9GAMM|nr:folate-binding protein YgfZ [Lysobacter bugurensis]GHA70719.1 folate-binding protein YgfZ [Lysobacter bugurensis]
MPDNPPHVPKQPFALTGHRVVTLIGADATSFAQAQFMNDVAALEPERWQWNGWLTPKGRLIALFALVRIDAETLWLVLPDAEVGAFAAELKRFVFRAKVNVSVRDDLVACGAFDAPAAAQANAVAPLPHGGVELDVGTATAPRTLVILPRDEAAEPDEALNAHWSCFDIEHGVPRLPASQAMQWTPQQLSLDRLGAFSVRKGCYPGQEIVARTHFLGKAKRGLALLDTDALVEPGAEASNGDAALGTVIAAASPPGRHVALAVVGLGRAQPAERAGGVAVREVPLRDGLER